MRHSVSALAAGAGGVALVLVWSGIHGANVSTTVKDLLAGRVPQPPADPGPAGTTFQDNTSGATAIVGGAISHSAAANRANGQLQAAARGWTGAQWTALDRLWTRESGWNNVAQNPHSTAYGIAQFLDSTWAGYGPKTSDPTLQIRYGLAYIANRYGDPVRAWAHETSAGWY